MTTADTDDGEELAAPLDLLLTDAALGLGRRLAPNSSWLALGAGLVRRPRAVTRRGVELARQLTGVAVGQSKIAPGKRDRRFADPAWRENPVLRRAVQAYLAAETTAEALVADAELGWRDNERVSFVLENVFDAIAPSNNPLISPVAWKAAIDTGGGSVLSGLRNLVRDSVTAPRVPSMVEPDAFEVGQTLATTPGAVVFRSEVLELIQYVPQREKVRQCPLLMIPPVINKFYVLDLAPGRSLVEYLLREGQQVFVISWRNPDARHRDWGLDVYGQAILDALAAVEDISTSPRTSLFATCSGGILAAMTLAHLAGTGGLDRISALTLAVTVLDQTKAGQAAAIVDEGTARAAIAMSAARGYLSGSSLAEVFAWLRPNDLVWNYWVNNYLQGRPPPPFDVLFWNADTTRMAATLHREFVEAALGNTLATPGAATMLGSPVDLSKISVDSYVIAGIADHISAWQACYRSGALLGGDRDFVLSTSGHIASMVNPPGNPKASFRSGPILGETADEWLKAVAAQQGSWWPHYARWLAARGGSEQDAPDALGGPAWPPLDPAPGTYVFES
jgi:poly[(R)-3-hydroxyalkanoate] polymerase subunit PhaC